MPSLPLPRAIVFISAAILLFSGCSGEKQEPAKLPPPLSVETVTVKKETVPVWLQYTGKTKASSEQEVRARVSGRLEAVYFRDGERVKKGQKLFKIEQKQYKAELDAALAQKKRGEASLGLAKADVNRYTPLVEEGLAPRATLEQHQARYEELKAQLLADQAKIDEARLQLSYTVVRAPVTGKVSARRVDVGNLVGYGEPTLLTTILRIDPIYAYFAPTEADVQLIARYRSKTKLDAFIEVRGSMDELLHRKRHNGYIDFADNTVDPLTSTVTMRATIDNPEGDVYPGTFVYVNMFVTDKVPLIMVPPQSLFEDQLGTFVYTVDENGSAARTNVSTGMQSRYYTVIKEGLKGGKKVIVSGLMKLKPGIRVVPTDVTASKGVYAVLEANGLMPAESE
jgi:RND family efflux transporter MFP subunit